MKRRTQQGWMPHVITIAILLGPVAAIVAAAEYEVLVERDVMIAMRDGVELAANISRPKSEGQYPVILVRTPYGKGNGEDDDGTRFAKRGYVFVIQDCRGTGRSKGEWEPIVHELADGLDTHRWILKQPWSSGKIGTSGGSYLGFTQWVVAPDTDESHKAMFTVVPLIDWYKDSAYVGGAFGLGTFMTWGTNMVRPTEGEGAGIDWDQWDWDKAYRHLPLSTWDEMIGQRVQFLRDWIAHPEFDDYWRQASVMHRLDEVTVPNITLSGWYDIFVSQAFEHVTTVRKTSRSELARRHQHVIVGPWAHGPNWMAGERDFGEDARMDVGALRDRWFDHWLAGKETGIEKLPPYRIFVMGRNRWRDEQEWPLARTKYTPYYFHSQGKANSLEGDGTLSAEKPSSETADRFVYDPDNPVPTVGGAVLFGEKFGAFDQREVERRNDVLVYSSDVLDKALEVTGPVKVVLYAESDARDTDFTAKLVDVSPDGRAYNLCDGILRARWRNADNKPSLIESDNIYRYEIDLWVTSNVFLPGHRIRVEISSSNFPRFDRNLNTGNAFGTNAEIRKAKQIIYHDVDHTSHILLPVISNGSNRD